MGSALFVQNPWYPLSPIALGVHPDQRQTIVVYLFDDYDPVEVSIREAIQALVFTDSGR